MKIQSLDQEIMSDLLLTLQNSLTSPEVPVAAAVFTSDQKLISKSTNQRETSSDPTAHAEILALRKAGLKNGNWNLENFTLYVTLEPCLMCAGAILQAKISRVVLGAFNPNTSESCLEILRNGNPGLEIVGGVNAAECGLVLSQFFTQQRNPKR
jgi:tRNA(adenine34) deaminase